MSILQETNNELGNLIQISYAIQNLMELPGYHVYVSESYLKSALQLLDQRIKQLHIDRDQLRGV